jgi:anti-anti-sigma regulatory factor
MEITLTQKTAAMAIMHLKGALDGSNYRDLIDEAQKLYDSGVRDLILELSQLTFISSAGISALYRVALIFRGEKQAEMEEGWASYHAISRERESTLQKHVKLASPIEKVQHSLDLVGFTSFFEIHPDVEAAVASLQ